MGFTKHTDASAKAEVLPPSEHDRIEENLHRLGKTKVSELTEQEKHAVVPERED